MGFLLGTGEFDVLWERLGLGSTPLVLQVPSPGRTHTERRAFRAAAEEGLAARGLLRRSPAALLRLLARPARQFELRARWGGGPVRAVAAGRGDLGVLAVRRGDAVAVVGCHDPVAALLARLPPVRPGTGQVVAAPSADADLVLRISRQATGHAQIVALLAGDDGVLRRSGGVLTVLDSPRGRYLLTRCTGADGVEWSTIAPTDQRRLRRRVAELLTPCEVDSFPSP